MIFFFFFSFLDKQLLSPSRKDADVGHRRHRDRKLKQKVLIPRNEAVRDNCVFPINPWNGAASLWLQLRSKHDSYCLQSALNYSHYLLLLMTKIPTVHPLVGRCRAVNNHNIPHCYKGTHCKTCIIYIFKMQPPQKGSSATPRNRRECVSDAARHVI